MAIYDGDQQMTAPIIVNGTHAAGTAALVKAVAGPSAVAYRFTAPFTFHHTGSTSPLHYRRGVSYLLDATTRAALIAAAAPMTAL